MKIPKLKFSLDKVEEKVDLILRNRSFFLILIGVMLLLIITQIFLIFYNLLNERFFNAVINGMVTGILFYATLNMISNFDKLRRISKYSEALRARQESFLKTLKADIEMLSENLEEEMKRRKNKNQTNTKNMGEIADDIIDGACCAICGQYFNGEPHGRPVACKGCYSEDCAHEKAILDTY